MRKNRKTKADILLDRIEKIIYGNKCRVFNLIKDRTIVYVYRYLNHYYRYEAKPPKRRYLYSNLFTNDTGFLKYQIVFDVKCNRLSDIKLRGILDHESIHALLGHCYDECSLSVLEQEKQVLDYHRKKYRNTFIKSSLDLKVPVVAYIDEFDGVI